MYSKTANHNILKPFAGDRKPQVAIAIFPVPTGTICPTAVSQIGRTLQVAITDLLLRLAAILPLPLHQPRHLFCSCSVCIRLLPKTQFLFLKTLNGRNSNNIPTG